MIFESQLGIRPSEWLKYAPLDDFLADNQIPLLPVEDKLLSISGLHITLLRLILASFLSVGAGILHRFVPTTTGACRLNVWWKLCEEARSETSIQGTARAISTIRLISVAVELSLVNLLQDGTSTP